jgi:GNAT superfamily N-acetyltransferase
MGWELSSDVDAFLAAAGDAMRARPADHTLLLTISESLRLRGPDAYGVEAPLFGWHRTGGEVDGTLLHTPPYPLILGSAPESAVPGLVTALGDRELTGLNAPERLGPRFAAARGVPMRVKRRERLYRLGTLTPPPEPPPGRAVVATPELRDRLIEFYLGFTADTHEPSEGIEGLIDDRLSHRGIMVWETPEGEPAGMASANRMVAEMVRIGPVYTPPAHRRRGIGAAVTAALSRAALDAGAREVLLFTDLSNPSTNSLYQRLGYAPVGDRVSLELPPAGPATPGGR